MLSKSLNPRGIGNETIKKSNEWKPLKVLMKMNPKLLSLKMNARLKLRSKLRKIIKLMIDLKYCFNCWVFYYFSKSVRKLVFNYIKFNIKCIKNLVENRFLKSMDSFCVYRRELDHIYHKWFDRNVLPFRDQRRIPLKCTLFSIVKSFRFYRTSRQTFWSFSSRIYYSSVSCSSSSRCPIARPSDRLSNCWQSSNRLIDGLFAKHLFCNKLFVDRKEFLLDIRLSTLGLRHCLQCWHRLQCNDR